MGSKFRHWHSLSDSEPSSFEAVADIIKANRSFTPIQKLDFGDHGLKLALERIALAIDSNKRIALYADYDVDGTMSCVAWSWFLEAIGFKNYVTYIPCRFQEGYGVNLAAVKHLIDDQGAQLIITMDTGITANAEAAYCRSQGVEFICTDHHKIQPEKMPDCIIVNPKLHPDALYQELCGCGVTFVLLRKLAQHFPELSDKHPIWTDLLALTGMATICDVVPLNGVNHRLARLGVDALVRSKRPILQKLRSAAAIDVGVGQSVDEKDVGFRLGPRINAVGRLAHAELVVRAFLHADPEPLIAEMGRCNERRKVIQQQIVDDARGQAATADDLPILFLGGDWNPGVVGIAASKIAEEFWRPTWLFQRHGDLCKGSARSIKGFDVTDAMASCGHLFTKFGGHSAAGGFAFATANEQEIKACLAAFATDHQARHPELWQSTVTYDCELPWFLAHLGLADCLGSLRPFGQGFEEPKFLVTAPLQSVAFYRDKVHGHPRHTALTITPSPGVTHKVVFFHQVIENLKPGARVRLLVTAGRNTFRGQTNLSLTGVDWELDLVCQSV